MNKQFKEKQLVDQLTPINTAKRAYIPPSLKVIPVEQTQFICTSVYPKNQDTKEEDYEDKGEQDNGDSWDIEIGF